MFIEVDDDATGCTVKMALEVVIQEGNRAPIAHTDYYQCFYNTADHIIYPLDNDSDPDGDAITLTSMTYPTSGASASIVDGQVHYTPVPGFVGTDTIVYTICDDGLGNLCTSDTIFIEVQYCDGYTGVSGVVINDETGAPIANVPVSLLPQGSTISDTLMRVTTANGYYSFTDLEPGSYLVQIQDANLNAAKALYPVASSLYFTDLVACEYQQHNFHYEYYNGAVMGGIVWYDINQNGIKDEWYDANNDGLITQNIPDANGNIDFKLWEWIDFNGDGSYSGAENTGELNVGGFGNAASANIVVDGPNNYHDEVIVGVLGYWRSRPDDAVWGTYHIQLMNDTYLQNSVGQLKSNGLMKVIGGTSNLRNAKSRVIDQRVNISTPFVVAAEDLQCGPSVISEYSIQLTGEHPVRLDLDFGYYCNNPPVAVTDYYNSIVNAVNKELNVLQNDYDIEGNEITLTELAQPTSGGTAVIDGDQIIYNPPADYEGADTIYYTICDDGNIPLCTQGMVIIMVAKGNPPIAVNDDVIIFANTSNEFSITGNDTDEDDNLDINSVMVISGPANGDLVIDEGTGYITYTPDECYLGDDSFTYQVFDTEGLVSNIATVSLTVVMSETLDSDGDNVPDIVEDLNGNGNPCDDDFDNDGIPDYLDTDDDNDGVLTIYEDTSTPGDPTGTNTDGDLLPDYHDNDDDGDCVLTADEDLNGDGNYFNDDLDLDGIPNFLDADDDNDGLISCEELGDLDLNGIPDYEEDWNSTAVDDNYQADLNAPLDIDILDNDTTRMVADSIKIIQNPNYGFVEINHEEGTVTYTPELNFSGIDSFVYVVCDYYGKMRHRKLFILKLMILFEPLSCLLQMAMV